MSERLNAVRASSLRAVTALTLAAIALLATLGAAPAGAAPAKVTKLFGGPITTGGECSPEASATKTDAAAFTDFCVAFRVENDEGPTGADLKSQVLDTPRGFAGMADDYGQCTNEQFDQASEDDATCPAESQLGTAAAEIRALTSAALGFPFGDISADGTATLAPGGPVFNLEHGPNEVARLGIDLRPEAFDGIFPQPNVKIVVRVTLRPSPDVGLRALIEEMPNTAHVIVPLAELDEIDPLAVDSFALTFWGPQRGAMPRSFAFLGADCSDAQTTSLRAETYAGTTTEATSETYQLTNCDNPAIRFAPGIDVSTSESRPDVTTESTVSVTFGESTDPAYVASGVRRTVVTLPVGLSLSGQIASGPSGLPLCTSAQFAQTSPEAATCPDATAVGTVSIKSPTQARPLEGRVFLGAQPAPGALPDLYLEAQLGPAPDAPRVKLRGVTTLDAQDRVVATLDDLPEFPVTEVKLSFRGGDHSVLVTPSICGDFVGGLSANPYKAPATSTDVAVTYSVNQDCGAVNGFAPSVVFDLDSPVAGAAAPFTTTITRPDRSRRIELTQIDLPAGLLANLKGVPECSQAAAAAGACPASTRIGTLGTLAGVGPDPVYLGGDAYLTERLPGAVAGLALRTRVRLGDVDLGVLNVVGRIEIRPGDLGLRLIAAVPERFKGIPLNLRTIAVRLDRPGFALNPTNCNVLGTVSKLLSFTGVVADAPATIQVGGCEALPFEPTISAAVTGSTGRLGRPNVSVRVENVAGAGALGKADVKLPKGLGVDLAQIPRACVRAEFLAGGCPRTAIIGAVKGALSITDEALAGDLYLLEAPPGQTLPGIGLAFTGRFAGRVAGDTAIDKQTGQIITRFDALPDLPLTEFQLDLAGGTGGALIATDALCEQSSVTFEAKFAAHSGRTADQTAKTYCGVPLGDELAKFSARLRGVSKGRPTLVLAATAPGKKKIQQLDFALPTGYYVSASRAKSRRSVALKRLTTDGKVSSKRTGKYKLRIEFPSSGTEKLRLLLRSGTVRIKSSSRRRNKDKITVRVKVRYTDGSRSTVPLRLTPR